MNKSKILFVLPTLKKDGAEVQISNLLSCFKNFKIDIFTFDLYEEGNSILNDLGEVQVFTKNGTTNLKALKKIIDNNNYEIVHSHLPRADFYVGILKIISKKFKHLITVHAQYGDRAGEPKFKYLIFNLFWRFILNNSDGVIAISNKIHSWLLNERGINKNKISTIHYGVKIKERNNKTEFKNVIGTAARFLPWKGWNKVIETAAKLRDLNLEFKLLLAGSDDENYKQELEKLVKINNLDDYVIFENHYENIDNFFEKIDLFLFLTESEGFGLIVLEAIENNVPVVCSNIEPLSEFVDDSYKTLVNRENTKEIADFVNKVMKNSNLLKKIQLKQKDENIADIEAKLAKSVTELVEKEAELELVNAMSENFIINYTVKIF